MHLHHDCRNNAKSTRRVGLSGLFTQTCALSALIHEILSPQDLKFKVLQGYPISLGITRAPLKLFVLYRFIITRNLIKNTKRERGPTGRPSFIMLRPKPQSPLLTGLAAASLHGPATRVHKDTPGFLYNG